jgi:hypothetical protein
MFSEEQNATQGSLFLEGQPQPAAPALPSPLRRGLDAVLHLLGRTLWNMATHDVMILSFHLLLCLRLACAPASRARGTAAQISIGLLLLTLTMLLACRGEILPRGRLRGVTYRVLAICCVLLSYFEMRVLLPALQPVLLDARLLAIDEALLGVTPALWLERWISPATTQWFAFFYYSYFWLLVLNLLGSALLERNRRRMHEMLLGGAVVAMLGHLTYTIVPGAGPHVHLAFQQELPRVFWWVQVLRVVDNAGALLDIFPSLHTAFPLFFALHAIRHRRARPFKLIWPFALCFALNIIVSTMFLRWHYAIDVIAGISLAVVAQLLAVLVARREQHRERSGRQAAFEGIRESEI